MAPTESDKIKSALSVNVRRFQRYFNQNQSRVVVLGIAFFALSFLSTLPYFNIVLNKTLILFIIWVLAVFLFNFSGRVSVAGALVCLGLCPLFLIFKKEHLAEEAANLAFGLLVIGATQEFISYLREEKQSGKKGKKD